VTRQLRDLKAVFASRGVTERRELVRFLGLPSNGGLPTLMKPADAQSSSNLTLASPFWPSGDDLSDVANALKRLCGGAIESVRLIGPPDIDDVGSIHPVIPAALVSALLRSGAKVFVAAADHRHGCGVDENADEEGEFDGVAENHGASVEGSRSLHAKVLIAEGPKTTRLAIGSFNLTRRGMGLGSERKCRSRAPVDITEVGCEVARLRRVLCCCLAPSGPCSRGVRHRARRTHE
jgi:phosphatidylserine/phosphatidylglycerophosphate/cardiolipin synthase-like enzyme